MQHSAVSVGFYFCQTPPLGKLDSALSGSVTIPSRWQKRDQYVIVESVRKIEQNPSSWSTTETTICAFSDLEHAICNA